MRPGIDPSHSCFGEALGHFGFLQAAGEFREIAGHHACQIVRGQSDPVVGDARLREVVSADFLGAVAGAYQRAAMGGIRLLLVAELLLVEFGTEDLQGELLVFDL